MAKHLLPTILPIVWLFAAMGPGTAAQAQTTDTSLPNYMLFRVGDTSWDQTSNQLETLIKREFSLAGDIDKLSFDLPGNSYQIADGYLLSKVFGLEAEATYYDQYTVNVETTTGEFLRLKQSAFGVSLGVTARIQVKNWFAAYGIAGPAFWRRDTKLESSAQLSGDNPTKTHNDGIDAFFGIGVRRSFGRILADLKYEKTEIEGIDVDSISLGFGFRF